MKRLIFLFVIYLLFSGSKVIAEDSGLLDKLLDDHSAIMLMIDSETGIILDANSTAVNYYGYTFDELTSMTISEINTMTQSEVESEMQKVVEGKKKYYQFKHQLADGSIRDVEVYSSAMIISEDRSVLVSIIHDITDRVTAEERSTFLYSLIIGLTILFIFILGYEVFNQAILKRTAKKLQERAEIESALLETTLKSIGEGVISTDVDGNVELMNPIAEKLTGWTYEKAKGCHLNEVLDLEPGGAEQEILKRQFEWLNKTNGTRLPIDKTIAPIIDAYGNQNGTVLVFRDYTERKHHLERIQFLSYHDQLTGLYNRHYFEKALKDLNCKTNLPLALVMLDVNGLKLTNDAFGHKAGDTLLLDVAHAITDSADSEEIIARIGGDEFVVLSPNMNKEKVERFVDRIHEHVKVSNEKSKSEDNRIISVSIGWAIKVDDSQSMHDIFIEAEQKMYRKKLIESKSMRNETIKFIIHTLYEANAIEKVHSEGVSKIAVFLGALLGLESEKIKELKVACALHDIGKISIDKEIVNKKGKLSKGEYDEIKRHSEIGYHILRSVDEYTELAEYILCHHERWDGTGYPRGLKSDEIPLISRIISVADALEAMTGERVYQETKTPIEAIVELNAFSGIQFDPSVVLLCNEHRKALIEILEDLA